MNKPLTLALASALALATLAPAFAEPGQQAPDFAFAGGKSLRALHGQPVVLIVAPSPRSRAFRKQVRRFEKDYGSFAARNTVFVAAFTRQEDDSVLRSSIPFVTARNGAELAARLGVTAPFALVVIGRDGNVDLQTTEVSGTFRVRDAILNNAELQTAERRL